MAHLPGYSESGPREPPRFFSPPDLPPTSSGTPSGPPQSAGRASRKLIRKIILHGSTCGKRWQAKMLQTVCWARVVVRGAQRLEQRADGLSTIQLPGPREGPGRMDSDVLGARREAAAWCQVGKGGVKRTDGYASLRSADPGRAAGARSRSPEGGVAPSRLPTGISRILPRPDPADRLQDPTMTSAPLSRSCGARS